MIHVLQFVGHVDDLKLSHDNPVLVTQFIEWLKMKYEDEEIGKMKASRGKIHDYLGMVFDFSNKGKVKISMKEYVKSMITDFEQHASGEAKTPAPTYLFNTRDTAEKLSEDLAIVFHNMVARGLFLCKRARPDIQTAIAFLSTRVKQPDNDDWKKLIRLINYLHHTKDLVLTLEADDLRLLKWFIDAAFAVHVDFKINTGGAMTLGKGFPVSQSTKQN